MRKKFRNTGERNVQQEGGKLKYERTLYNALSDGDKSENKQPLTPTSKVTDKTASRVGHGLERNVIHEDGNGYQQVSTPKNIKTKLVIDILEEFL